MVVGHTPITFPLAPLADGQTIQLHPAAGLSSQICAAAAARPAAESQHRVARDPVTFHL